MKRLVGRIVALAGLMMICQGCGWTIHPPSQRPFDAVPVFVSDYGWHSSVLLPLGDGKYMEYVFGDWHYAAEGKTSPFDAFGALVASRQGTLGRRIVTLDLEHPQIDNAGQKGKLVRLDLSEARVEALLTDMDKRYKRGTEKKYNPGNGQTYVKVDEKYSWTNSCNTLTKENMEKLGCRVDGSAIWSNFKVTPVPGVSTGTWKPPVNMEMAAGK